MCLLGRQAPLLPGVGEAASQPEVPLTAPEAGTSGLK